MKLRTVSAVGALALIAAACGVGDGPAVVDTSPAVASAKVEPPVPTPRKLGTTRPPLAVRADATTISADGRYAATAEHKRSKCRVTVRDLRSGRVVLGPGKPGGIPRERDCNAPTLTGDGRFEVHNSRSALVPEDTNKADDVYLVHLRTDERIRVSVSPDGTQGNRSAYFGSVSNDGRWVGFTSRSNLDPGHPVPPSEESDDSAPTYAYLKNTETGRSRC